VPLEEPKWWYAEGGGASLPARLLSPAEEIYAAAVEHRFSKAKPFRCDVPVICVGNFTAGGTGKTPLARFLIASLQRQEIQAACLSRGYGGTLAGPVWVDRARHTAREVGDEPMLLAAISRVMIARDRRAGLEAIAASGETHAVIMDDGLQNPGVAKDLSIAVVDARRGFGNGRVIPSGPLRARLAFQLGLVDCIVVMGSDPPDAPSAILDDLKVRFPGPVLRGVVAPSETVDGLAGRVLVAYAGIANPDRFFNLLERFAPQSVVRRAFADHHAFSDKEAAGLIAEADAMEALLVTTEKDHARLMGATGACATLAARSRTLPIEVSFDARDLLRLDALIDGALKGGAARP
jgi:tetraacyldisaccharide 4'-kinase